MAVLNSVPNRSSAEPTRQELMDMIFALKDQLTAAQSAKRHVSCKIGEKGNLVISGFGGRYPVSLYLSQFEAIAASWDSITAFVEANRKSFATKTPI